MDELDNASTAFADDVVVVPFGFHVFEAGLTIGEVPFRCQAAFFEEFHSAVHRSVPHAWVNPAHLAVKLLDADVTMRGEKDLGNILSLRGGLEALLLNPLPERFEPAAHGADPPLRSRRR